MQSGLQISCLFIQILKQYNCKGCASSMIHPCQVSLGISLKSVPFLLIFSLWSYEAPCKLEFSISSAFPVSHQHLLLRFLRFWLAYHAQPQLMSPFMIFITFPIWHLQHRCQQARHRCAISAERYPFGTQPPDQHGIRACGLKPLLLLVNL